MIKRCRRLIVFLIMVSCLWACSASNSELMKSDSSKDRINVIILMPIDNKTKDARLQKLLNARLLEELRFKGYPQIEASVNGGRSWMQDNTKDEGKTNLTLLKNISGVSGADAAMYCTLQESKASASVFYSPATVSVRCELRSTKTGETIWDAQHRSTRRSFDMRNSSLNTGGALESALDDVVGKVMETLPYGPKLRG